MANILTVGCPSDHEGVIITGDPSMLVDGKPVARIGDLHACPRFNGPIPHGTEPIVIGTFVANRPTCNGMPVAVVGDKVACGATLLPFVSSASAT